MAYYYYSLYSLDITNDNCNQDWENKPNPINHEIKKYEISERLILKIFHEHSMKLNNLPCNF